jgi:hypothetical protein
MKIRSLAIAVSTVLLAAVAWAADLTGTWKGEISGPNGNFALTYSLKQDGTKLTGTVTGPQGDPLDLIEGKVEGGKVHFAVNVPMNGGMKFVSEGTVKGDDEITVETKSESGDPLGGPMTLKRQK